MIGANKAGCLVCNACSLGALVHGALGHPLGSKVVNSSAPAVLRRTGWACCVCTNGLFHPGGVAA